LGTFCVVTSVSLSHRRKLPCMIMKNDGLWEEMP
jgi:hypothetical protein